MDLCGPTEPCIAWGADTPVEMGTFERHLMHFQITICNRSPWRLCIVHLSSTHSRLVHLQLQGITCKVYVDCASSISDAVFCQIMLDIMYSFHIDVQNYFSFIIHKCYNDGSIRVAMLWSVVTACFWRLVNVCCSSLLLPLPLCHL